METTEDDHQPEFHFSQNQTRWQRTELWNHTLIGFALLQAAHMINEKAEILLEKLDELVDCDSAFNIQP
jgi:hypothetical protein